MPDRKEMPAEGIKVLEILTADTFQMNIGGVGEKLHDRQRICHNSQRHVLQLGAKGKYSGGVAQKDAVIRLDILCGNGCHCVFIL